MILIALVSIPILMGLLEARESGLELTDIGTRAGLLLGGILMFLGNPLYGIGAGGFQAVMIDKYLQFLPWGIKSATVSHTYIVTILAEQGIIGFIVFCVFLFFIFKQFRKNYKSQDKVTSSFSLIIFASTIIIFIGAQAEARFFEEPLLWLFMGLSVALEKNDEKRLNLNSFKE
jgi:O-antigen ligase